MLDIRAGDAYPRLAATIRASSAVDLCFEIVGDPVKGTVGSMVRFKKSPKMEILSLLRFHKARI